MAVPLCAIAFLIWIDTVGARRVVYVSGLGGWSEQAAEPAAGTAARTGGFARKNWLIVPGHNTDSYHWIVQTQQMFARGEWRVRHIDYENAPFGREVYKASPYRWWLGLLAWCDHAVSGRPLDQSVERAALFADPLLHLVLLAGTALFVAWRFGVLAAALLSIGLATLFPFASEFLPGMPDDHGLGQACAIWSVLPLLIGLRAQHSAMANAGDRARRWFFAAGVAGGVGLWIGVPTQAPIVVGIALGAPLAAWMARRATMGNPSGAPGPAPWGAWALGGAVTCLGTCLIEYFPAHLGSWHLRAIHPLHGIAWLGLGLLVTGAAVWIQRGKPGWRFRDIALAGLAIAAIATVPVVMWLTKSPGFLAADLQSTRLTKLSGGPDGTSLWAWMVSEGITLKTLTTVLPALLILPAVLLIVNNRVGAASRASLALALGPVLVALGIAGRQLIWWNQADAALLVLLIAINVAIDEAITIRLARWAWSGLVALVLLLGAIQIFPRTEAGAKNALDGAEIYGLVERDFARWLALHAGPRGAMILTSHNQAITLYFYGGLRGLGGMSWDNRDGLGVAVRILSASTPEEARELIDQRGITHIVIPSWDSYFDAYTRIGIGRTEATFSERLAYWRLPSWLKPVPYQFPTIAGFEGQSVTIFEVVEDQDDAAAMSRTAEYFVEMKLLDTAASAGQSLRRFPADPGALAARAQVAFARGDTADYERTLESLQRRLSSGADRVMAWDRRVSLAVVLARAKQPDLAREQVRRCMAEADEARLRTLTTDSLYRLQVLGKAYGLEFADHRLHELALELLPSDLRRRL